MKLSWIKPLARVLALILAISISSCSKSGSGGSSNPPPPGAISGSFVSNDGVLSVALDTVTGAEINHLTPNTDGTYIFTSVRPGSYIVKATMTKLYNPIPDQNVTVTSGDTAKLRQITQVYNSANQTGTIQYTFGGAPETCYYNWVYCGYSSGTFTLDGTTNGNTNYLVLQIKAVNVGGAGTYPFTSNSSYISVYLYSSPGVAAGYWTSMSGGSATLTVGTLDITSRATSGSFTGTLQPQGATKGTFQISGTWSNVIF